MFKMMLLVMSLVASVVVIASSYDGAVACPRYGCPRYEGFYDTYHPRCEGYYDNYSRQHEGIRP